MPQSIIFFTEVLSFGKAPKLSVDNADIRNSLQSSVGLEVVTQSNPLVKEFLYFASITAPNFGVERPSTIHVLTHIVFGDVP